MLCHDVGATPSGDDARTVWQRAVEVVGRFSHPNVARFVEVFSAGGREYLVLEAGRQNTLEHLANGAEVRDSQMRDWLCQVCDALSVVDSNDPPLVLDVLDASQILADGQGRLKLVNFRLSRALASPPVKVLGESEEDRAATYRAFAELLSHVVTRKRRATLDAVRTANPKLAAVVQRCHAFLQTPGLSFQELKRAIIQALPEQVVVPPSKLESGARGMWELVKSVPLKSWLKLATGLAVVATLSSLVSAHKTVFAASNQSLYVVCNENKVQYVDGQTHRQRTLPILSGRTRITDTKLMVSGKRLVVCDHGEGALRIFNTLTNDADQVLMMSSPPDTLLGDFGDRDVYVVNAGRVSEVGLAPMIRLKGTIMLKSVEENTQYALLHDDSFLLYSAPKMGSILCVDLSAHQPLKIPIIAPAPPSGLAVSPDNKELWVATLTGDQVYAMTLDSLTSGRNTSGVKSVATMAMPDGSKPSKIVFSPDGRLAAVLSGAGDRVMVVRTAGHELQGTVRLNNGHPSSAVFAENALWVTDEDNNTLDRISLDSLTITDTLKVGGTPSAVTYYYKTGE